MKDKFNRKINYLRISVIDRCNLRCVYCMPESGVASLAHEEILSYEEILRIAACFARLGISRIKITGGEPLLRKNILELIGKLKQLPGIEQVTLTTNGILLSNFISRLSEIGIDGINLSLDTLNPELYAKITRRDSFHQVYEGLQRALTYPDINLKINCVPLGIPEQNLPEIAGLAKDHPIHVRFIEMMPIGLGKNFTYQREEDILHELEAVYGTLEPYHGKLGNGPCHYYSIEGFQGKIGFISAISHQFCSTCNRIRLTAEGKMKVCLQYDTGVDLRELLRSGKTDAELEAAILHTLEKKPAGHHFTNKAAEGTETKSMFQIGG